MSADVNALVAEAEGPSSRRPDRARRLDMGDRVRLARDHRALSRSTTAREAGIEFTTLQAIECGYRASADEREALSRYLWDDPRVLLTRTEADAQARTAGLSRERWIASNR